MIEENMLRGSLVTSNEAKGGLGFKGERGYSAYEIAVQNGYEGTEQEWIDHFGLDLTDYLKTSDVVDNLTSTSTTKPLSAKQGKLLNDGLSGHETSIDSLEDDVGDLSILETTTNTDLVAAINEVFSDNNVKGNAISKDLTVVSGTLGTDSWVYCANNYSVEVEKGNYLILSSVTLNGLGTGIATTNLTINGNREGNFSRNTIPLLNGLGSTANNIYYRGVSSTQSITFNMQVYASAASTVASAMITLIRIK